MGFNHVEPRFLSCQNTLACFRDLENSLNCPYSSELDDALHSLEMQGLIDIKAEGIGHKIYLTGMESENYTILPEEKKTYQCVLGREKFSG